jgi:hypothetical protein
MRALFAAGFGATLNLCAEMPDGDLPTMIAAGLDDLMDAPHRPLVDMTVPAVGQIVEILDELMALERLGLRTHLNCHAGRLRAGVVVACYRMAVMGWGVDDALTEARNFGNFVPMQLAFIEAFGDLLADRSLARAAGVNLHPELQQYPLLTPGSVRATPRELTATLGSAVRDRAIG